jgi:hypothetical protein
MVFPIYWPFHVQYLLQAWAETTAGDLELVIFRVFESYLIR